MPPLPRPLVYIASLGEDALEAGLSMAARLRSGGKSVITGSGARSLKAQMRQANALGAEYVAILGEDEVREGTVTLRDMRGGQQQTVAQKNIENCLADP